MKIIKTVESESKKAQNFPYHPSYMGNIKSQLKFIETNLHKVSDMQQLQSLMGNLQDITNKYFK